MVNKTYRVPAHSRHKITCNQDRCSKHHNIVFESQQTCLSCEIQFLDWLVTSNRYLDIKVIKTFRKLKENHDQRYKDQLKLDEWTDGGMDKLEYFIL